MSETIKLIDFLKSNNEAIKLEWVKSSETKWDKKESRVQNVENSDLIIQLLIEVLQTPDLEPIHSSDGNHLSTVKSKLTDLSKERMLQGFTPEETLDWIASLKNVLLNFIHKTFKNESEVLISSILKSNTAIDKLGSLLLGEHLNLFTDKLKQQSLTIMELSTPTITLWDEILLLPLFGVIDTKRASQLLENLLGAIVSSKSNVAILDVTGVPIIDTRVAQHILKTVQGAKMLGSEVILTGISAQTAQTIVKLNLDLSSVRTCSTLQKGLEEAFSLTEKTVISNKAS